jgi:hypothetical protein
MNVWLKALIVILFLIGLVLLRWPRSDADGDVGPFKWREIAGFGIWGVMGLLYWWMQPI